MLIHLPDDVVDDVAQFLEAGDLASAFGPVAGLSGTARTARDRAVRDHETCALAVARALAAIVTRTAARNPPPAALSA